MHIFLISCPDHEINIKKKTIPSRTLLVESNSAQVALTIQSYLQVLFVFVLKRI